MKKSLIAIALMAAAAGAAVASAIGSVFRPLGEMLHATVTGHMARNGLMLHAITSETKNSQGQSQRFTYSHLDDAATPALITLYPGFKPSTVRLVNVTDRISYEWHLGMNQGDYLKTVAAGTRTLETDDVLDVERDAGLQVTITVAASIVLQNKRYFLEAIA